MSKLANISGKEAARAFSRAGWKAVGQVGSHLVLSKAGEKANLSIPQHKELSGGTLRALIRRLSLDGRRIYRVAVAYRLKLPSYF